MPSSPKVPSTMLNTSVLQFLVTGFSSRIIQSAYPLTWAINISNITYVPCPLTWDFQLFNFVFHFSLFTFGAMFNLRQSCMSFLGETFHWPYSLTKYSLLQNPRTSLDIPCDSLVFSAPSNPP